MTEETPRPPDVRYDTLEGDRVQAVLGRFRVVGEPSQALSAEGMLRVVVALLGVWVFYSGLTLTIWQGIDVATVVGDLNNGPAQRLLGVHLLILAPVFWLFAWDPEKYRWLFWVPYAHQWGVFLVTVFELVSGKRDFPDAALPVVVTLIFVVLLSYIAIMRRQAAFLEGAEGVTADRIEPSLPGPAVTSPEELPPPPATPAGPSPDAPPESRGTIQH